jgi:hypothetical protein
MHFFINMICRSKVNTFLPMTATFGIFLQQNHDRRRDTVTLLQIRFHLNHSLTHYLT